MLLVRKEVVYIMFLKVEEFNAANIFLSLWLASSEHLLVEHAHSARRDLAQMVCGNIDLGNRQLASFSSDMPIMRAETWLG